MEKTLKLKYVAPEVVDFKWMQSLGDCISTGSGDGIRCDNNGNNAGIGGGSYVCTSNGISASGSSAPVCSAGTGAITNP